MSWHVEARGRKSKVLDFCVKQKYFIENAPIGVQQAMKILTDYFPETATVSIICSGHLQSEGGSIKIEIQNIPAWVE